VGGGYHYGDVGSAKCERDGISINSVMRVSENIELLKLTYESETRDERTTCD
jgi:hypothetical protein